MKKPMRKKRKYADGGDIVMGGASGDTSGLSLGLPALDMDIRRPPSDAELMQANLDAVRRREAMSMAKPKATPKPAAKKAEAPKKSAPVAKKAEAPKKSAPVAKKAEAPKKAEPAKKTGTSNAVRRRTPLSELRKNTANPIGDRLKSLASGPGKATERDVAAAKSAKAAGEARSRKADRNYTNYRKGGKVKKRYF